MHALTPDSSFAAKHPKVLTALHTAFANKAIAYADLGLTQTALFHTDKITGSANQSYDPYPQARLLYNAGQCHRALHLLSLDVDLQQDPRSRLLASQCLFALEDFDECLAVLGDNEIDASLSGLSIERGAASRELQAALCVMRARVHERMENPSRAMSWYKRALRCDLACTEAFLGISETGLLSKDEAATFIKELTAERQEEDADIRQWLSTYYRSATDRSICPPSYPYGVATKLDFRTIQARRKYDALDFAGCAMECREILKEDPFVEGDVMLVYLASLVELDARQEIFTTAHKLVDRAPKSGLSWLAVGYYYFAVGKPEVARRFLQKATSLNQRLAPAWVAFGHAFGAQDESDQAMASYRTASRLFPGAQLPTLFMGMEYARQNSLSHASILFQDALKACPSDPAPRHELGVVAYRMGDHARAVAYFKASLSLWEASDGTREVSSLSGRRAEAEEATLVNLGHCYRRLRDFGRAKRCYERALGLSPRRASTCTALGMTLHAMWNVEAAIGMYHRALRNSPDDANCSALLERALWDLFSRKGHDRIHEGRE